MLQRTLLLAIAACAMPLVAHADFIVEDTGKTLAIAENGKPVLVYQYDWVNPPVGVEPRFRRTGYIHPLYGIGGEVLTEDYPSDHYHHRGVFWGWPNGIWKEKRVDTWGLDGARQVHVGVTPGRVTPEQVSFAGENHWILDEAPDAPIVSESYEVVVRAATDLGRDLDFTITLKNISEAPFSLRGATTDSKGYGGFNFRPDAARKPMRFVTALGPQAEDTFEVASPWVDVSYATAPGADTQSGAAIFQHPSNPNYPHHHWLIRHYAFLGHAWPGNTPVELAPGDAITVKYRLYTHRGTAEEGKVAEAFERYLAESKL